MNQFYGFVNQSINQSINLYVYDTMIEYSTNSYQSNFNVVKSNQMGKDGKKARHFIQFITNKQGSKQASKKRGGWEVTEAALLGGGKDLKKICSFIR